MDAALQNKAAALGWTQPEIDAINSRVKLDKIGAVGPYPAAWMDIWQKWREQNDQTQGGGGKKKGLPGLYGFVCWDFFGWCQSRVLGDEMMNY